MLSSGFPGVVAHYALENKSIFDEFFRDKVRNDEYGTKAELSATEKELFSLYHAFAFRKKKA